MALCGVDVGGTFTDVVLVDEVTGELNVKKVRSSHPVADIAVLSGAEEVGDGEAISRLDFFVHGTTIGLNAILEGRGPKLAMFCTRGFRDVLEMRRSNQTEDPYNLFWHPRPPLVPRSRRFPISGRISAAGEVIAPLSVDDVEQAMREAEAGGAEGIVVAFINAYVNPEHEREVEQILRSLGYDGEVTLSHRVSREHREYERTSTATINGFIRPHVSDYLVRLGDGLAQRGFSGTSLITRSGGGALTFSEGEDRPFETLLSGPVAGVEGAAFLGRRLGHEQIITADVGGTSFDTALILHGRPIVKHEGNIAGMPVQTQWVDVRSIGAGGGSIASVDPGGLLRVGPKSAGSDPGPASYGSGGTEPTVTDAAVALGLFPVSSLSGEVTLDVNLAEAALAPIAARLEFSVPEVAAAILRIAAAKMADAIREITVECGEDPRTAALVAFGGAGPLFATQLADELELAEIIVPPFAGVFSAWGLLVTDAVQVRSQTHLLGLEDSNLPKVQAVLDELYEEISASSDDPASAYPARRTASLDLRHVGQEHHLSVPVAVVGGRLDEDATTVKSNFAERYLRTFGNALAEDVEIVAIRAEVRRPLRDESDLETPPSAQEEEAGTVAKSKAYSLRADDWLDFAVVDRSSLKADEKVSGPALLVEGTTVSYVDLGHEARPGELGTIRITHCDEVAAPGGEVDDVRRADSAQRVSG